MMAGARCDPGLLALFTMPLHGEAAAIHILLHGEAAAIHIAF